MTRRDAAVLLFVAAGLYFVLVSLEYLAGLLEQFAPPVTFPPDMSRVVYFVSYLIPFGLLLAGGQFLIRARHTLADSVFADGQDIPQTGDGVARVRAVGSLVFAGLGLLSLFMAVNQLTAVVALAQPNTWHEISTLRAVLLSVLHPLLLGAYVLLGWYLLLRRESLAARWLLDDDSQTGQPAPSQLSWQAVTRRALGLYFVMLALTPLSHSLVRFVARGPAVLTANAWDFWPDAVRGTLQLLFGLGVFLGKSGLAAAWQRVAGSRAM